MPQKKDGHAACKFSKEKRIRVGEIQNYPTYLLSGRKALVDYSEEGNGGGWGSVVLKQTNKKNTQKKQKASMLQQFVVGSTSPYLQCPHFQDGSLVFRIYFVS